LLEDKRYITVNSGHYVLPATIKECMHFPRTNRLGFTLIFKLENEETKKYLKYSSYLKHKMFGIFQNNIEKAKSKNL
jgi:hypothetical protein